MFLRNHVPFSLNALMQFVIVYSILLLNFITKKVSLNGDILLLKNCKEMLRKYFRDNSTVNESYNIYIERARKIRLFNK